MFEKWRSCLFSILCAVLLVNGAPLITSYKLSPSTSALINMNDNTITPFWNNWAGKDSILMTPEANAYPGRGIWKSTTDARMVVKSVYNDSGIYLLFIVEDDTFIEPVMYDITKDRMDFQIDGHSADEVRQIVLEGEYAIHPDYGWTLTNWAKEFDVWTSNTTSKDTLTYGHYDKNAYWYDFSLISKLELKTEANGSTFDRFTIDSKHRGLEFFISWKQLDTSTNKTTQYPIGRNFAFCAGYNDMDNAISEWKCLRWLNYDPYAPENSAQSWGDIVIGPGLEPTPILKPITSTEIRRPVFSWYPVQNATGYQIIIDNDSSFTSPLVNKNVGNDLSFTPALDLPCDTIYWKVSSSLDYSNFSSVSNFSIYYPTPNIIRFFPDTLIDHFPTFKWHSVPGAPGYVGTVSFNKSGSPIVAFINGYSSIDTAVKVLSNIPSGKLYWQVQVSGTQSRLSPVDSFVIVSTIPELYPYSPDPTLNRRPTLSWRNVYKAQGYIIYIDTNPNFKTPLYADFTSDTRFTPADSLPARKIYWRVSSNHNYDSYSSTDSFTIQKVFTRGILMPYPLDFQNNCELLWTPFGHSLVYSVQTNANVEICIIDMKGKVALRKSQERSPGRYIYNFTKENTRLHAGHYMIYYKSNKFTKKISAAIVR